MRRVIRTFTSRAIAFMFCFMIWFMTWFMFWPAPPAADAQTQGPRAETTSPEPTPVPSDPAILERVKAATSEAKAAKAAAKRTEIINGLETFLDATINEAKDEPNPTALRYQVALEPVFEKKTEMDSKKSCKSARAEMVHAFSSGSGFSGVLPEFVLESLKFLAAVCQDDSLAKAPKTPGKKTQ